MAAESVLDHCVEHLKIDGLCQIIIGPQAASGEFAVAVAECGQEDKRDGGVVRTRSRETRSNTSNPLVSGMAHRR